MAEVPDRHSHVYGVIGRLAPGVSPAAARARLDAIASRLEAEHPATHEGTGVRLAVLLDEAVGAVGPALWLLLASVALILVLAVANLTNLLLVRASGRGRELAVRTSLGATRWHLARQILLEAAVLGSLATGAGSLATVAILKVLPSWSLGQVPRLSGLQLGGPGLVMAFLLGLGAFGAASLLPIYWAIRQSRANGLRTGRGGGEDRSGHHLRQAFVGLQVGLAMILLTGSGLLLRSYLELRGTDTGFAQDSVLAFELNLQASRYPGIQDLSGFHQRFSAELAALPGVVSAGAGYDLPLDSNWTQSFALEGITAEGPEAKSLAAVFRTVTPSYFETLGIEILEGRALRSGDHAEAPGAAVVNQAFVETYFPDRQTLGRRLRVRTTQWQWGEDAIPDSFVIVGVIENVRFEGLREGTRPAFYLPFDQTPHYNMKAFVRTERPPRSLLPEITSVLQRLDPMLPLASPTTLEEVLARQTAQPRLSAALLGAFAASALAMAVLGLWGTMAYTLALRRREVGVRIALGADRRSLFTWLMALGMRPVLAGLGAGLLGALLLGRLLSGLLFEVSPSDPVTYLAVPLVMLAAAGLACLAPARRATRVDPIEALRLE